MENPNQHIIYHLYPLGALGAPERNDHHSPPTSRTDGFYGWTEHAQALGATAILLGPVFESSTHGYDTADYFRVDRRLGSNEAFARWSATLHQRGLKLILDGVFHHVGRNFWAFQDVLEHQQASRYRDWFFLDFQRRSPYGDPFFYEGWNGHIDLVKLNVRHPEVRQHLFDAVRSWIDTYGIDGLRLDAADVLDLEFQKELAAFCRSLRPDFWLLGEVIHGDYRAWTHPAALDSVTNYELYKGLYSSHNDRNYFEIAYSLDRQFGPHGIYRGLSLYTFTDNHDVERIASRLHDPAHLYPLHALLFTMPGIPSIYYGSESGIAGRKGQGSDAPLRPALNPDDLAQAGAHPDLQCAISRFISLRRKSPALQHGDYRQLHVAAEQLAFMRTTAEERVVVAVNAAHHPVEVQLTLPERTNGLLIDRLNDAQVFRLEHGQATLRLEPCWARILWLQP
jgi:cyclomaltodextrinase